MGDAVNDIGARDLGAAEQLSRRRFLRAGSAGLAGCAVVAAGCQQSPDSASTPTPKRLFTAQDAGAATAAAAAKVDAQAWPAISYAEGVEAVRQFEEKFGIRYGPDSVIHSVTLATSPTKQEDREKPDEKPKEQDPPVFFNVRYIPGKQKPALPDEFAYEYEGQAKAPVPIVTGPEAMPKPHGIKLGHRARHVGLALGAAGSVGWVIRFNGKVVCVSAYHVLRDTLGSTGGIGGNVELNGAVIADLYCYQPIIFDGPTNTWDLAMASFRDERDVDRAFRPCDDGTVRPSYPMRLSPSTGPASGDAFFKVGNGDPRCGEGEFREVGNCTVNYSGRLATFKGQLYFTKFAGPGDSGTMILRKDDLSVTGLYFTGTSTRSISCPMFRLPWGRSANHVLPSGQEIPNYTAAEVPPACCGGPV